jgi:protein phosphatase
MTNAEHSRLETDTLEPGKILSTAVSGPASTQVKIEIAGATHTGHVRRNNEDHYLAISARRSLEILTTNLEDDTLEDRYDEVAYGLLVADGMGGMAAGEVASRLALCKAVELIVNTPDWVLKFNQRHDEAKVMQRITQRFRQVDDALRAEAASDKAMTGMGTTLTAAVSLSSTLLIGHIGDSRAYVLRDKTLHQLTKDHTLAQTLIDAGVANKDDESTRALHHVLTAALGATQEGSDPQVLRFKLAHNDQILLCTDGLTEMVPAEQIASVLNESPSSQTACDSLINMALSAGGTDNVTVVMARYQFPPTT